MSVNKVIIVGRIGKDPEVRHLESGKSVASFSVATSERYKDKNGNKKENTEWFNVVLWSPLSEVAEKYLKKGDQVYIEGKLSTRSYEAKDGGKRYITEVVGRELVMLGGGVKTSELESKPKEADVESDGDDGDSLPF